MGDHYEVKSLGKDWYLEYWNESTGWQVKVIKLGEGDIREYEAFRNELYLEEYEYLKELLEERVDQ